MSKAIITILGIQGGYVADDKAYFTNKDNIAKYYFENATQNKTPYFNTLPLLIEKYSKEFKIVPLFTRESEIFNKEVLKQFYPKLSLYFDEKYHITDEKDFKEVFGLFNQTIQEFDEVIIDVTHGFRHLPLLMLIDLLIVNFKDISKIKHILFAKEIKKHTKSDEGLYEIIDLKEYLDLANISYALSSFSQNYTISKKIETSNQIYNEFLEELSNFSEHILANSLDALIVATDEEPSISDKLISKIDTIINNKDDILQNFAPFLEEIKKHIKDIKQYKNFNDYEKMYKLSENMLKKGYLLNAITLLHEAIGLYCKETFKKINPEIKAFIETFEEKVKTGKDKADKKYQLYSLTDQSKNLYKLGSSFRGDFLAIKYPNRKERSFNEAAQSVTIRIKNHLLDIRYDERYINQKKVIEEITILRNNLAHGNSSKRLGDVEKDIQTTLNDFNKYFLHATHKTKTAPEKPKERVVKDLRKKK